MPGVDRRERGLPIGTTQDSQRAKSAERTYVLGCKIKARFMAQATLMIKKVRRQGGLLASTDNDNSIVRPSRTTVPVFPIRPS